MCSEWENHKNHGLYNPSKSYLMDLNLEKTFFIKQEKYLAFFSEKNVGLLLCKIYPNQSF